MEQVVLLAKIRLDTIKDMLKVVTELCENIKFRLSHGETDVAKSLEVVGMVIRQIPQPMSDLMGYTKNVEIKNIYTAFHKQYIICTAYTRSDANKSVADIEKLTETVTDFCEGINKLIEG